MTRIVKKWARPAALVLTVACLALGIAVAPAQAQPPGIPHNFYGYAYINGAQAAVGKTVVAKINDVQVGSTTVTTATGYNYQIQVTSATGGTVVFWVDGVQATPTATYSAGSYTQLNLYTYTTTLGVTTGSASSIASNSATLGGTLTGLGSSPTVYVSFEYGLTTAYGSTTPAQAMSATGSFSVPITGLTATTTYNFRAKVTDGATTVNGSNATFTTTSPVLTVTTGSATGITTSTATLTGTLSDMGAYSSVSVSFEYGPTTSYGSATTPQTKTTTGAFSATISGLTAGTTYYFRAKAVGGSETKYGSQAIFTTSSQSSGCNSGCCHWFWGTAYLNSSPVSGGTVAALVNGVASGASTTTNSAGDYNIYVPVTSGSTVTFTVNGGTAAQSATASCMGYNGNFNLYVSQAALSVATGSATYASTTTATLGGTLSSLGTDTSATVSIEYGLTTSYGSTTTSQSMSSTGAFTGTATGLTVGQTYHYRAKAVGSPSGTTAYGTDATYVHGNTLAVTTGSATYASTTTATLGGTLSSLGTDTSATVSIEYGLTTSYGSTTTSQSMSSTGAFTGTATGLTVGQTYHYRAKGVGSPSGTTVYGTDATYVHAIGALTITTTSLPGACLASAYSATLQASGGTTPYTWSISSGTLPTGLTLAASTGVISGTPTTTGTSSFTVQVADAAAATATKPLSITVSATCSKLVGADEGGLEGGYQENYFNLFQFQAVRTGNAGIMKVKAYQTGNVKVAIYSDNNGEPDTLLGQGSGAVTAGQWNDISITSAAITSGSYYWLACISQSRQVGWNSSIPTISRHKVVGYYDFTFPSSAGTDFLKFQTWPGPLLAGY